VSAVTAAAPLDLVTVRRKLRDVREALAGAVALLGELYDGRAWVTLGLGSWQELVDAELPELAQLLTVGEKRALVVDLRQRGLSLRAAAAPAGVSAATAKTWTDDAGVQLATVTSLDGRQRPGTAAETSRAPRLTKDARTVIIVREAGAQGVTVHDVVKRMRLGQCSVSARLSRLSREGGPLVYLRPEKRGQTGRYVAP